MKFVALAALALAMVFSQGALACGNGHGDGMGSWTGSGGCTGENPGGPWGPGGPNWQGPHGNGSSGWDDSGYWNGHGDGYNSHHHHSQQQGKIICSAQDRRGVTYGVRGSWNKARALSERAVVECQNRSRYPNSCRFIGCDQ